MNQGKRRYSGRTRRRRRRRQRRAAALLICIVIVLGAVSAGALIIWEQIRNYTVSYEADNYDKNVYQGALFASDLCVAAEEVDLDGFQPDTDLHAAGLFDLGEDSVLCGYKLYDRLYPASTTKIMTALLALKYGNMDDVVTVSSNATDFKWDEVTSGLRTGDKVKMYDLVCGLLLHSGNDCATAIAEHIAGSVDAFADMMNEEAASLGATGTHFVNPHGLHNENHYTTAYDLYLIFNECIKDERFVEIISMDSYDGTLTGADGTVRKQTWTPTQAYGAGEAVEPDGVRVLGGKTGTTQQAGNCVILYDEDDNGNPYISVIMGADGTARLYDQMNTLMQTGIAGSTSDQPSDQNQQKEAQ
ncbi:MAG TPA: D-alanyl-D-alanine carboxypeptidase [Candidatus Mediterraneibacter gallistercoris]|uniref:D-alanyl-D-alanine carboxypeptidase n=1 Tax=Candidatus Mediterraneibacter gallistercoris TaxID=2838671 RepID=A0A9D2T0G5_9FIRM|nr:D-alanyl-D-alanine carboxypeptidase [Candidatus Mediterraneibacter gallistercoris]